MSADNIAGEPDLSVSVTVSKSNPGEPVTPEKTTGSRGSFVLRGIGSPDFLFFRDEKQT